MATNTIAAMLAPEAITTPAAEVNDVLRHVDALEGSEWDARLGRFPDASVFHGTAWLRALNSAYGFEPCCHVGRRHGADVAVLPLVEVDSWLTGRRGVSLPFTDECPALSVDADALRRTFVDACAYGRSRHWRYLELRGDGQNRGATPSLAFLGHRLVLTRDSAKLFERFNSATRRAVRRAELSGVETEFGASMSAMREFHTLVCRTRRRHGLPPAPYRFLEAVRTHLLVPGHGSLVLARHAGVVVAGAVYLHCGTRAIYKYGASDERYQHVRANNLVMWRAIQRYADWGFTAFDFGRTSPANAGLRTFKLGWATTEYPITYCKFDLRAGRFVTDKDRSSGWHTQVFRALPPLLSRAIGAALYKHIG